MSSLAAESEGQACMQPDRHIELLARELGRTLPVGHLPTRSTEHVCLDSGLVIDQRSELGLVGAFDRKSVKAEARVQANPSVRPQHPMSPPPPPTQTTMAIACACLEFVQQHVGSACFGWGHV
jgi:hypothetical protein